MSEQPKCSARASHRRAAARGPRTSAVLAVLACWLACVVAGPAAAQAITAANGMYIVIPRDTPSGRQWDVVWIQRGNLPPGPPPPTPLPMFGDISYRYDPLGQLVKAYYLNGSSIDFQYDAAGNRERASVTCSPIGC